jgi:hypothetical protein
MKWGERRYQNKDGTLTAAGKRRYNRDADEKGYDRVSSTGARYKVIGEGKKARNERLNADIDRYVNEDYRSAQKLANESSTLANKLKTVNDTAIRRKQADKLDLSNMTDQEMRNQINRALLERQYNDMFAPKKVSRGREVAGKVLEVAGGVLGVTGTALGIALSIRELMGKGSGG